LNFDVFNGDADGICALHQMRLSHPLESELITGVKRDIKLLEKVSVQAGDQVLVLDISFDKNRAEVQSILNQGASIQYFDHHYAGDLIKHSNLATHINTSSEICTSLIVNNFLQNAHVLWAIVGSFGDNMAVVANSLANNESLSEQKAGQLNELGILLNYNGYGAKLDDLYFEPQDLFNIVRHYKDPFDFIENEKAFTVLKEGYSSDMENALSLKPYYESNQHGVYLLPTAAWSNRVSGVFSNHLTAQSPERAHAILSQLPTGNFIVSVRAPLANREGADTLCRQFPSGGGRKAAAGINNLPEDQFDSFISKFKDHF